MLTSQIAGYVQEIRTDDTQLIKADEEVIKLDPMDTEVSLHQTEARLGTSVRQ